MFNIIFRILSRKHDCTISTTEGKVEIMLSVNEDR